MTTMTIEEVNTISMSVTFSFQLPKNAPSSVTLQPAPGDTGKVRKPHDALNNNPFEFRMSNQFIRPTFFFDFSLFVEI